MSKSLFDGAVVIDRDILGGTPVFRGTRVPLDNLFEFLETGEDLDTFLATFPRVERSDAVRVLQESSASLQEAIRHQAA